MTPLASLVVALIPDIGPAAAALKALFVKLPQLTPEQITAAVVEIANQADANFLSAMSKLGATPPATTPQP